MAPASFWNTEHVFNHTWDLVATFYWSRYPNPFSSHVFSEDMVECAVGEDGVLRTKRLIVKTNKLPWWGKHLFSAKKVAVVEETTVDPNGRVMTTYTRNIGLTIFMGTTEKNFYRVNDKEGQKTVCEKNVWITSDIVGLRSAIRKFGIDRFKANCVRASDGLKWAIDRNQLNSHRPVAVGDQGVTSAPPHHPNATSSTTAASQTIRTANFMAAGSSLPN